MLIHIEVNYTEVDGIWLQRTSLESQVDKSFISLAKHVYVQKHEGTKIQDISVKKCLKFQSDKLNNSVHYQKIVNFEAMIVEDT